MYPGAETVESAFFRYHLRASQALCKDNKNFTACQLLGNLCVMFMYNEDNFQNSLLSSTDACKEYLLITNGVDWPVAMPWLYYKASTPVEVLDKTDIVNKFRRGQKMQFVLVKYSATGRFLGIKNDTSEMQLCADSESVSSIAYSFTTTFKSACKLKFADLLKKRETYFYDLYLLVNSKDLYPVPILVDNIGVNQQSDRTKWKLTRRFFLVDNLSGRSDMTKDAIVVQYASSVELLYRLRGDGQIYPPLLKIKYTVVKAASSAGTDVGVTFKVAYEMDTVNIQRNIEVKLLLISRSSRYFCTFVY